MSETFVVADTHINHYGVVLHCNRSEFIYENPDFDPSKPKHMKKNWPVKVNLEAHDEYIINKWNSTVTRNDRIWILGDLAWKNHAHYIQRLAGKKFLIRGNHDKMNQEAFRLFQKIDGAHYQYSYYTKIHGRRVMFAHCPYATWFSSCHGSWHFYGHCHGRREEIPWVLSCDCGWDVWGGLIPWNILETKMLDKERIRKEYFSTLGDEPGEADRFVLQNKAINQQYLDGKKHVLEL